MNTLKGDFCMKQLLRFQPRTTDFALPYLLTRPDNSEGEYLPMIVFLHGAGERGSDGKNLEVHGIPRYFGHNALYMDQRVITLSPQCPEEEIWSNFPSAIMELILAVAKQEQADMNRISITGISMGGFGTWSMLARYPDFFCAAAPLCGGGVSWYINTKTPIRAFHGDADMAVPLIYSQLMVDTVNARGGHAELTIYPDCPHDCWTLTYEQTNLIPWLATTGK
jgi:predicted peptidase